MMTFALAMNSSAHKFSQSLENLLGPSFIFILEGVDFFFEEFDVFQILLFRPSTVCSLTSPSGIWKPWGVRLLCSVIFEPHLLFFDLLIFIQIKLKPDFKNKLIIFVSLITAKYTEEAF